MTAPKAGLTQIQQVGSDIFDIELTEEEDVQPGSNPLARFDLNGDGTPGTIEDFGVALAVFLGAADAVAADGICMDLLQISCVEPGRPLPGSGATPFPTTPDITVTPPPDAGLVVTTLNDAGAGSLRDAIITAGLTGEDLITFAPGLTGTITLTQLLRIEGSLEIVAPGADQITLSGNDAVRAVEVMAGSDVTIRGLTISRGREEFDSAGLLNSGTLLLEACRFTANQRGLITTEGSITTLRNCTFSNNQARDGGGLANFGTMTIEGSTFLANMAVEDDDGFGGGGGAIFNSVVSPHLEISGTTFMGNTATLGGGAMQNNGPVVIIENSQFLDNRALGLPSGDGGAGGAIFGGSLTMPLMSWVNSVCP